MCSGRMRKGNEMSYNVSYVSDISEVSTSEILEMLNYLQFVGISKWCGDLYQEYKAELASRIPEMAVLY